MQRTPWRWMAGLSLVLLVFLAGCQGNAANAGALTKASTGPIRITLDHTAYSVNDPIGVTVSNTSKDLYYAVDGKSACTLLQLQKYDSAKKQWGMVYACTVASPVHSLQIPAGISESFSLAPSSAADENAWQTGAYRVAVVYTSNADGVTDPQTAYSASFAITS